MRQKGVRAVITAGGARQHEGYPATTDHTARRFGLPVMDYRAASARPPFSLIIEEGSTRGFEEVCLVVNPHNRAQTRADFAPADRAGELKLFKGKGNWPCCKIGAHQQIRRPV